MHLASLTFSTLQFKLGKDGDTALIRALWQGEIEVVKYLVENGAKLDIQGVCSQLHCLLTLYNLN